MNRDGESNGGDRFSALIFGLQGERFAVPAEQVREILDPVPVTEVPGAKPYVAGLINVRGRIVPLADLRVRLGMDRASDTIDTRFIVLELVLNGEATAVGVRADKVHQVQEIDRAAFREAPAVGLRWRPEFIEGVGRVDGFFVMAPNLASMFGPE